MRAIETPGRSSWKRLAKDLSIPLLIIAAVCIGIAVKQHDMYKRFAAHDPNKVYRSSWLPAHEIAELVPKHKVRTVINLCTPGEEPEWLGPEIKAVEDAGARFVMVPFPANNTSRVNHPGIQKFEALLADPENYPIWVHCYHGRERTAKALAMYDILHRRMTASESIDQMDTFGVPHTPFVVNFAHNYEEAKSGTATAQKDGAASRR